MRRLALVMTLSLAPACACHPDRDVGLDGRPANSTCVAPPPPPLGSGVVLTQVYAGLNQPLGLFQAPGDAARVFVQEREGLLRVFPKATPADITGYLDLHLKVSTAGEGGLLGVAFHPQWPTRAELFVSYTEASSPLRTVIARYRSADDGLTIDPNSEERLLVLEQPYSNHNGGHIAFGNDGYLYLGLGDGGSGGDPENRAQRLNTLLGKFVRIDVEVPAAQRYAIPADNPYAGDVACNLDSGVADAPDASTRCAEIYAVGVRNPWRWSFDRVSGELWAGDVGQGDFEEVDRIERGGNYGWKVREGFHCFGGGACASAGFIDPVLEYPRDDGNSITGGYVYRGAAMPDLVGKFVFGDFGSGRIWAVESDGAGGAVKRLLVDSNLSLGSFGEVDGELYALDLGGGRAYRLDPDGAPPVDTFPTTLGETGCFDGSNLTGPALVPYSLNAPFWSDGALKQRLFAVPDGKTITITDAGDFDFPAGSVLVKHFSLGATRVETRLFMRHADGTWAGYSYEWNDAGTDATLLAGAKTKEVNGQTWLFPSRAQCLQCHTAQAGRTLGPELAQLNRAHTYASTGRTADQLHTLEAVGYFTEPLPQTLPRLPEPFADGPLEPRARAWLHSNCAPCHQQGFGQGPADWRYALPFADTHACNAAPRNGDLGLDGGALIVPGHPERSLVSVRLHALDARRMPPIGSVKVDDEGAALIDGWISSLTACP